MIRVKDGVQFTLIAPAGFHIIAALERASATVGRDLTITSACDGEHSGPDDPHHKGEAYDIRTSDLPDPEATLSAIMNELGQPKPGSGGWVTDYFFGWLEAQDTPNQHIHVQLRRGMEYPPGQAPGPTSDLAE